MTLYNYALLSKTNKYVFIFTNIAAHTITALYFTTIIIILNVALVI